MAVFALQVLNGLSYASTLFLMAAGLTLVFGVTRVVNFAHGSFFMLGGLLGAHALVNWWPVSAETPASYALVVLGAAVCAAVLGAAAEWLLLRRMYNAPELYQLVSTLGLSLVLHDAMRWALGPEEVFAPRFPGLKGSVEWHGEFFPTYQLLLIFLGPVVWGLLHLGLHRTGLGARLRAATQDRQMLTALGVRAAPLMTLTLAVGCGLAGLAGALQLPREPAHLQMDTQVVVETFVVVVMGGLGSLGGAFLAALLVGQVHSFGIVFFPQSTLVLVFLAMGLVLALRPRGLLGRLMSAPTHELGIHFAVGTPRAFLFQQAVVLAGMLICLAVSDYGAALLADFCVLVLFGLSLQALMALGGQASFGHAAFFGLGAYGAALSHLVWGWSLPLALLAGSALAAGVAGLFGAALVRSAGVYLAMLSLALAQVVWAAASQWTGVTGGDNGLIGLSLVSGDAQWAFRVGLCVMTVAGVGALRRVSRSPWGAALQAARDAPERSAASGLPVLRLRYQSLVASAAVAGLAGGLMAAEKGAVFPSAAAVGTSVDVLTVVLLGGLHHVWGSAVGALILVGAGAVLGRDFDFWRGALGLLIMLCMLFAPTGLLGWRREKVGQRHA